MANITIASAAVSMSSREIADLTGSSHDNVLKTVRALVDKGVVSGNETPYRHPQNGQIYSEFQLSYRDTMVVVSGYSVELRAKIIDRWQELEAKATPALNPANLSRLQLIEMAMQAEQERLALEHQVEKLAPKAQALDRLETGTDGSFCLTDAAKALQVPPRKFIAKLQQMGWLYRRPMGSGWLAYQDRITTGLMEHKMTTGDKSDGSEWASTQARVTAKGMARLASIFTHEPITA
jgi:phage antirepressor YoqD-like protein